MDDNTANFVALVLAAAEELNPSLEEPIDVARGAEAPLYGDDGPLDSLALVTLTSTVEQRAGGRPGHRRHASPTSGRSRRPAAPSARSGPSPSSPPACWSPPAAAPEVAPADETGRPVSPRHRRAVGHRPQRRRAPRRHRHRWSSGCSRNEADWSLDGYTHVVADVGDEREVRSLLSAVRKEHGRLDHVVSCAGAASMNHVAAHPGVDVRAAALRERHGHLPGGTRGRQGDAAPQGRAAS